ncbi:MULTISPECIES: TetR/AcrR family transcriptional regulator [Enterococcus]|uniref:TetR/AcrR family transcriptional regulator n=1 Tax=Enterococcus TaxID=1350 RepID=UPI00032DFC7B|nr:MULTISPECIES: TetR/AcrR family transcriptional regulator [Enterococcus]EGO2585308.1 TetR/AcrR family transcriptional regulator [Enterococcus faecalis]EGO2590716.1 TetR/AcrR family transcriptional regulator [Enterococcus faecalis]EGO2665937.1 TetR/AcrR family transcriptional regulator [Enterococcus faecalis]EGO2815855.1 TetR/AcrR family transcriptional regulator [Enterococcus faecalis]EGO2834773.1 TetR/AcrR family transcriptional regulator [Enterococcus faecalis]
MYKTASDLFNRLKVKKRENILNYALSEFGTVGYEAASVRKIADKANMSVGSLYQYFSNKQGMLAVAIEHIFNILNEYIDEIKSSPLVLESRLETMFDMILKLGKNHPELIVFYNKIPSDEQMTNEWIKQFYDNKSFFETYWDSVRELQEQREIKSDIDPVVYTFIIDTMMLSGELLQNTQYQEIKAEVFLEDSIKSSIILKENVIEALTLLAKE